MQPNTVRCESIPQPRVQLNTVLSTVMVTVAKLIFRRIIRSLSAVRRFRRSAAGKQATLSPLAKTGI
jgi:hypothetical protein